MEFLIETNTKIEDTTIYLSLLNLHKSFLLLISDQPNMGIGNVTLCSPSVIEGIKTPTASYSLFGMNTKLLSTIIAEKATSILKAPVLLLLFLKNKKSDEDIIKPIVNFLNETLEKISKKIE